MIRIPHDMERRGFLGVIGSLIGAGCSAAVPGGEAPTKTTSDSSPTTADCSDATITSVSVTALTSGDTITVEGKVSNTPAPSLRGFIIERSCPDRREISLPLNSTGSFKYEFEYAHHGIVDYGFWLDGCSPKPTPERTITC